MTFKVNKDKFVNSLMTPASKLADNILLTANGGIIKTLTYSTDNTIILQSKIPYKGECCDHLYIPEIKNFIRLLLNIDKEDIELTIDNNSILYKAKEFKFKYHLLDKNFFQNKKSINEEKINSIKYSTSFTIPKSKISDVLKYNAIIPEAEKLYFYQKQDQVVAKLGDKQKPNINEIEILLSESIEGDKLQDELPLNIQNVLMLTFPDNSSVQVSINSDLKVFRFQAQDIVYIISGLVK